MQYLDKSNLVVYQAASVPMLDSNGYTAAFDREDIALVVATHCLTFLLLP